jgi:hypothetical protein
LYVLVEERVSATPMDRGGSPFTPKSFSPRIPRTATTSRRSGVLPSVKKLTGYDYEVLKFMDVEM